MWYAKFINTIYSVIKSSSRFPFRFPDSHIKITHDKGIFDLIIIHDKGQNPFPCRGEGVCIATAISLHTLFLFAIVAMRSPVGGERESLPS